MKLPSFLADTTLFQKASLLFSLLTLLFGGILYLVTAIAWPALLTLFLFNLAALLLIYRGGTHKALRVIGRVLLLMPPVLAVLILLVYLILLWAGGYTVSVPEIALLVSLLIGSAVLFATPTLAFLALKNTVFEQITFRVFAVISLVLSLFTVLCTLSLKTGTDDYLLITSLRHPILYALLVACALATVITAAEPLFNRAEQASVNVLPLRFFLRRKKADNGRPTKKNRKKPR